MWKMIEDHFISLQSNASVFPLIGHSHLDWLLINCFIYNQTPADRVLYMVIKWFCLFIVVIYSHQQQSSEVHCCFIYSALRQVRAPAGCQGVSVHALTVMRERFSCPRFIRLVCLWMTRSVLLQFIMDYIS